MERKITSIDALRLCGMDSAIHRQKASPVTVRCPVATEMEQDERQYKLSKRRTYISYAINGRDIQNFIFIFTESSADPTNMNFAAFKNQAEQATCLQ